MLKKNMFLLILLVLCSCGEDNPTKIVSEKLIYENKNLDSDLNELVEGAVDKINELGYNNISMDNFPTELIGIWKFNCSDDFGSFEDIYIDRYNDGYSFTGIDIAGEIYDIRGTKTEIIIETKGFEIEGIEDYVPQRKTIRLKMKGDQMFIGQDPPRNKCPKNRSYPIPD
jgi:hypothetical protein